MERDLRLDIHVALVSLVLSFVACSGGGGSTTPSALTTPTPPPTATPSAGPSLEAISIDARSPALATVNKDVFGAVLSNSMALTSSSTYVAMMTALRTVHVGLARWPSSVTSDYYHWQSNSFSSCAVSKYGLASNTSFDQFMQQIAQPLGVDVAIDVNYGSNPNCTSGADPNEAAAWVDYANNQMGYGVKYWSIGSEQYFGSPTLGPTVTTPDFNVTPSTSGPAAAATYASLVATQFYPLMKAQDPTIQVGVDLAVPYNDASTRASAWDSTVLGSAKYDFVTVHWYANDPGNVAISDNALLTSGISFFSTTIAKTRAELANAGKPNTPIYVGEWGVPGPAAGTDQDTTIVGALFTAGAWGELVKAGVGLAAPFQAFENDCFPATSGYYTQQNWYSSSLFMAFPSSTNPECPSAVMPPVGTVLPRGNAMLVVEQAFNPGDTVFAPTVGSSLSTVKAYAARRGTGYGVLLINIDENNAVTTTLGIINDARSFTATSLVYGKAQYDNSQTNVWTAPVSQSLGTVTDAVPIALPPWSVTAITLASTTTLSHKHAP